MTATNPQRVSLISLFPRTEASVEGLHMINVVDERSNAFVRASLSYLSVKLRKHCELDQSKVTRMLTIDWDEPFCNLSAELDELVEYIVKVCVAESLDFDRAIAYFLHRHSSEIRMQIALSLNPEIYNEVIRCIVVGIHDSFKDS